MEVGSEVCSPKLSTTERDAHLAAARLILLRKARPNVELGTRSLERATVRAVCQPAIAVGSAARATELIAPRSQVFFRFLVNINRFSLSIDLSTLYATVIFGRELDMLFWISQTV